MRLNFLTINFYNPRLPVLYIYCLNEGPTPYGDRPIRTAIKRGRSSSAWKKLPSSWLENVPKPKEINDLVSSFGQMDFNDGGGSIGLDSVDSTCRPISYCDFRNEPLPNAGKINPQFLKANNTKNKNKSKSYSSSSSSSASFQGKSFLISFLKNSTVNNVSIQ